MSDNSHADDHVARLPYSKVREELGDLGLSSWGDENKDRRILAYLLRSRWPVRQLKAVLLALVRRHQKKNDTKGTKPVCWVILLVVLGIVLPIAALILLFGWLFADMGPKALTGRIALGAILIALGVALIVRGVRLDGKAAKRVGYLAIGVALVAGSALLCEKDALLDLPYLAAPRQEQMVALGTWYSSGEYSDTYSIWFDPGDGRRYTPNVTSEVYDQAERLGLREIHYWPSGAYQPEGSMPAQVTYYPHTGILVDVQFEPRS